MAILPDKNLLEGTKEPETTTGEFRLAMGNLRQFIAELLGNDSSKKQDARDTLGAQEKYRADAAGTADALTAAFTPPILKPLHGLHAQVRAKEANTNAAPTFRADETGALPVVKGNNLPLLPGDIAGDGHWLEMKYDATLNKWVLENPACGVSVDAFMEPKLAEKADKTELDEKLAGKLDNTEKIPVGSVIAVAGNVTPDGYLHCNGAPLLISVYPELFAVIGYTYGGDGATMFHLPDLRNRWMRGSDKAGGVLAAGLPNLYGTITDFCWSYGPEPNGTGVFAGSYTGGGSGAYNSNTGGPAMVVFNASLSNGIYGASDTVCPPSINVRYCIKY
ncbi:tail fiber protein [Oxalobacter paraformigenes]|uniref:Phage tail collar domain-containing protein n=1 Tax=Oxalobacter paraformigenes TaxID=556268 RepID=C3X3V9_9BURK|nr:tail fiber protein [Oxalobacter paraformigenes]EEO27895.1 hypothetical protein OFAG_01048 [Oxalobacter paraformigenes]